MREDRNLHKKKRHKKASSMGQLIVLLIVAVVVTSALVGGMVAKYVTRIQSNYSQVSADAFYFSSDFLSPDGEKYTVYCSDLSKATVDFSLWNFADSLNYSGSDIPYTIEYELHGVFRTETGSLSGGSAQAKQISYALKNFGLNAFATQAVVSVTAHAQNPYEKTLRGTFTLIESENALNYYVSDSEGSNAGTVTVTTGGLGGTVNVKIPTGCIFDPTSTYPNDYSITTDNTTKISSLSFVASSDAEYSFVYLKENPMTNCASQVTAILITNGG